MLESDSSEGKGPGPTRGAASPPSDTPDSMRSVAGLRLVLPLMLGVAVCLFAGWFELTRALGGHRIAWIYVFEWPFFAIIGCYMWWRLRTEGSAGSREAPDGGRSRPERQLRRAHRAALAAEPSTAVDADVAEDVELLAWQRYLAKLQADDPPGAPPPR